MKIGDFHRIDGSASYHYNFSEMGLPVVLGDIDYSIDLLNIGCNNALIDSAFHFSQDTIDINKETFDKECIVHPYGKNFYIEKIPECQCVFQYMKNDSWAVLPSKDTTQNNTDYKYFNFDTILNNNISNDYIKTYLVRLIACNDAMYFRFEFYNDKIIYDHFAEVNAAFENTGYDIIP